MTSKNKVRKSQSNGPGTWHLELQNFSAQNNADDQVSSNSRGREKNESVNNSSHRQRQDAKAYFGTLNESNSLNNATNLNFGHTLALPQTRESQNNIVTKDNQIFQSVTPSDLGIQARKKNTVIQQSPDQNSASEKNPQLTGGQDDFTQGGTNFGTSLSTGHLLQNEDVNSKQHFELLQGQPVRSHRSLMGSQNNRLACYRYKRNLWGLTLFLWDTMVNFDSFVLLFHTMMAALAQPSTDESWHIIICVATISIIGQASINLFNDQKLKNASDSVNKLTCEKFIFNRRQKRFQLRHWDDLCVGDIIKIKKNSQVPADCLILDIKDSNPEPVCYVKGSSQQHNGETEVKRSCQNTQNKTGSSRLSDSKFVQLLSGQLKWEINNRGKYHGSMKLNENPAAFEFKNEHVISRGSSIYMTEQVICLVLNIGDKCLGSVMKDRQNRAPSFFNRLFKFKEVKYHKYYYGEMMHNVRILQILAISISFLSWLLIVFVHLILGQTAMTKFEQTVLNSEKTQQQQMSLVQIIERIFSLQAQYLLFYPYLVKLVLDCVIIFHNLFVLWDINLVPYNTQITNYFALTRLSQVSNLVLSPSSILGYRQNVVVFQNKAGKEFINQNPKIKSNPQDSSTQKRHKEGANGQIQGTAVQDGTHQLGQYDGVLSEDSDVESTDHDQDEINYLPMSRNTKYKFENYEVSKLHWIQPGDNRDVQELLRACVLCHSSIQRDPKSHQHTTNESHGDQPMTSNCKSIHKFDEAQLNFANSFKFNFVARRGQLLTISAHQKQDVFEEMAMTQVDLRGVQMTVQVLRVVGSQDGCTMLFKAPLQAIKVFMKEDLWARLEDTLQQYTKQGVTALTFAKRELDSEYSADLFRVIADVQTLYKGNQQKLQEALMTQCENLDLIGILGVKQYLNYRNSMFMEEVLRNGVKVWLLSSQLEYETIIKVNATDFLSNCQHTHNVKGQSERQVEESLKTSLKAASDRMQQHQEQEQPPETLKINKEPKKKKSSNEVPGSQSSGEKVNQPLIQTVFTNGYALSIIMKDDSLLKIFLILCSLCDCVVGSHVSPAQKADIVKAMKEFNVQANLGYVLSIIGNASDMYTLNEADVKIGLIQKYRSSDNMAITDLNVSELHSLTYILFKHASHLNRRMRALIDFFFYRTILMMSVMTYYIISAGLSPILPFQMFFTMIFIHVITPLQIFLYGISHKDFGFDQFHRIFGEYTNNSFVNTFRSTSALSIVGQALFDAFLLIFFSLAQQLTGCSRLPQVIFSTGQVVSNEAFLCYNTLVLSLIQLKRIKDNNINIKFFQPIYFICLFVSISFVLEDDSLVGLSSLFQSPAMILQLVMVGLVLYLQQVVYKVMRTMLPTKARESMLYYKNVEDMIFMEEYEDCSQEFQISNNPALNQQLSKMIQTRQLVAVNQNMMRLHRSDSMDQILERINITGESSQGSKDNKIVNRSTLINKYLKLNDFNKELEYQNQPVDRNRQLEPIIYTLYSLVALLLCHIVMVITFEGDSEVQTPAEVENDVPTEAQSSETDKVAIVVTLATLIVLSLGLLIVLKRIKDINYGRLLLYYIFLINVAVNVEKSFTPNTQHSELIFMAVITCTFLMRLNNFFTVMALATLSLISYCSLSYGSLLYRQGSSQDFESLSYWQQVEAFYRMFNIIAFFIINVLYSYWDEATRKISFVINFRKQKEFQKSKQILNILVPGIVRAQIQEGQKNFSEAQGVVTIVFCDIEGFDELVQLYEGKELIELLDQTFNAYDQLCDQYGLQKIETVGKTYMAAGGLKIVESTIDQRLLGNHFSVRVLDYTFEMLNVANSIKLKTGQKLKIKIGVHTGEVLCGVIGETKPQFSLIGDTVNKTARVCSKCPTSRVLISKETYKQLEIYSNNFQFEMMEVFMKGLGQVPVYKVQKKGIKNRLANTKKYDTQTQPLGSLMGLNTLQANNGIPLSPKRHNSQLSPIGQDRASLNQKDTKQTAEQIRSNYIEEQTQFQEVMRTEQNSQDSDRASDRDDRSDVGDEVVQQFGGNFKEDRMIVGNPALNIKYKLVERPRFLLQFNQKEQEQEFQQFISKFYIYETTWFLIIKACVDSVLLFTIGWRSNTDQILYLQLSWVFPYMLLAGLLIRVISVTILNKQSVVALSIVLLLLYFSFAFAINTAQSLFDSQKEGVYTTCKQQLGSYALLVFTLRAYQTRCTTVTQVLFVVSYTVHVIAQLGVTIAGFSEIFAFVAFATMLTLNSYFREMSQRKQYNNERIIDIEIEKTEDLLSKLVPIHVLTGIKQDQRVVDVLDNVTLLYTDMVGFTAFSNGVKNPVEVVQLLSKLFSKFDQLTEAYGVYKVHTIGDCYVIMGYTGKTPKYRRTTAIQIQEAYSVVRVGLEMIEIIKEIREASTDPNLKSLDMRIGIHTGKIVGGVIGSKVVRYDIFGQDVLIANKMESNGEKGHVNISDSTLDLLNKNQFIMNTLDVSEHTTFEIGNIGKKVTSYFVKQIFMSDSNESLDNVSSHDYSSNEDNEEPSISESVSAMGTMRFQNPGTTGNTSNRKHKK